MTPRPLAACVAGTLALLSALHVTWVFSSWPLPDRSRFAKIVVGTSPDKVPSGAATSAVAALLASASLLVARCAAPGRRPPGRIAVLGSRTVAGVLLARAVGGFIVSGSALVDAPATYRRLDLTVYSPLCLALSAGAARVAATAHRTDR